MDGFIFGWDRDVGRQVFDSLMNDIYIQEDSRVFALKDGRFNKNGACRLIAEVHFG